MNHITQSVETVDPNPTELAEYTLTISCFDWQTVDGDAIMWEMVPLYDMKVKWTLIEKVLSDLERFNSVMIYVGSLEKCEKWSEIFLKQGLMTKVDKI